jgi:DNA-binding GntR family transcriptional regulator
MSRRQIVKNGPVPFYAQLRDILAAEIDEGSWRPGELLPSEAELTSSYQISRTVIRKALDALSNQGRITRIKGKGTVVVDPFLWRTSPELSGSYDALASTYQVQTVLENRLGQEFGESRAKLGIDPSVPILHVVVISERPSQPGVGATLSSFDIAGDASPALARLVRDGKTPRFRRGGSAIPVQLVAGFGLELSHSPTTVNAVTCDKAEAALLGAQPTNSVLCFEWVTYDRRGRAVIAGRSLSRGGSRLHFVVRHTVLRGRPLNG